MKPTKYHENDGVITVQEWARGMKGVVYVVREADGSEGLRTVEQIKALQQVKETPKRTPARRKKRTPKRDDRWVECAGHMAAGTDPVTAGVVSGVFDRMNKPIKIDWGRMYGPKDLVPLGVVLYWGACTAFLLWWVVRFAI